MSNHTRKPKGNKSNQLPDKLLALPNLDKKFHESWFEGRNMLNFPHPFRAVLFGPPNTGKSTTVKNIIVRADPPYEKIVIIHCDPEYSQDYAEIEGVEMMDRIPPPSEWDGEFKTLVVLDDLEFKQMSKDQKRNLDRLFGYVSTHKNISCCLCSQDGFNIPTAVRRCANVFIVWKSPDTDTMVNITRKAGFKRQDLESVFNLTSEFRDSIWIDLTSNSPYPLRKNGFQNIIKENPKKKF